MTETITLNLISNFIYSILSLIAIAIFRHFFKINKSESGGTESPYKYNTTVLLIKSPYPIRTTSTSGLHPLILFLGALLIIYLFILHQNDIFQIGCLVTITGISLSMLIIIGITITIGFSSLEITDKYILLFLLVFWALFFASNYALVDPIINNFDIVNIEQSIIKNGTNNLIQRVTALFESNPVEMMIIISKLFGTILIYTSAWYMSKYKCFLIINLIVKFKTKPIKENGFIHKLYNLFYDKNSIPTILFMIIVSLLLISGLLDDFWYKIIHFLQSGQLEKIISDFFNK
ncbi:hypothetical protein [Bacillus mycoides]|uniref:hypothetical protein n=1 Tax=Bacillus mycoides TaxID=1405 RepID=UPI001C025A0A|nr:hypothetical protein [Bacillus mycoides]QWH75881.1 hypothetical protein EXW59_03555 [Bacillus mycoides]